MRATDVMIDGEYELVCGYGDEDKSCAFALRDSGVCVFFADCDAIIFRFLSQVTSTSITLDHMKFSQLP